MTTIKINEADVVCSHEIKTDEKTNQTSIHVTVKAGDGNDAVKLTHVLTIGAEDHPLPEGYDTASLQRDLDVFREKHARMAESKLRAKKLAQSLQ
jgi:hypothetical protein